MTGPLAGIKVIDVTTNISGPTVTMILADLGAEVIKIERPGSGDDARRMGPLWKGEGVYFLAINRNKRSIVIDLTQDEGKTIVDDLLKDADVFVENFRFGVADRLGLSYEKLKEKNERLIYCSLSAYGEQGPKRYKPGYDAIVQADTGIMSVNGSPEGDVARAPVSILDQGSAMWGAIGIISALYARSETGKGQKVTTSLYETGLFWMGYHSLAYKATGEEPQKLGSRHAAFAPYGAYETSDIPIMIGVSNNTLFAKVCRVIGRKEWVDDPRFKENINRVKNQKELDYLLEREFKKNSSTYWVDALASDGVPCSVIQSVSSVLHDEQAHELKMFKAITHPQITELPLPRLPFQLSATPVEINEPPPLLGEDTIPILQAHGVNETTINTLIEKGVIETIGD